MFAKMYLWYQYSHGYPNDAVTPFIPREIEVWLVAKSWDETQATSSKRRDGQNWSERSVKVKTFHIRIVFVRD